MYALDAAPLGYYTRLLNYNCALLTFIIILWKALNEVLDNVFKVSAQQCKPGSRFKKKKIIREN